MGTCRPAVLSVTFTLPGKHANHVPSPEITRPLGLRKLILKVGCACPLLGQVRLQGLPPPHPSPGSRKPSRGRPEEERAPGPSQIRVSYQLLPQAPWGEHPSWGQAPASPASPVSPVPPSLPALTRFQMPSRCPQCPASPPPPISTQRASANLLPCSQPDLSHPHLRAVTSTSCWPHHLPRSPPTSHSDAATGPLLPWRTLACTLLGLCTSSPLTHPGSRVCGLAVPRAGHECVESSVGAPSPSPCGLSPGRSQCAFWGGWPVTSLTSSPRRPAPGRVGQERGSHGPS